MPVSHSLPTSLYFLPKKQNCDKHDIERNDEPLQVGDYSGGLHYPESFAHVANHVLCVKLRKEQNQNHFLNGVVQAIIPRTFACQQMMLSLHVVSKPCDTLLFIGSQISTMKPLCGYRISVKQNNFFPARDRLGKRTTSCSLRDLAVHITVRAVPGPLLMDEYV